MKFKNFPSWLKGGIVGGLIPLLSYLFLKIIFLIYCHPFLPLPSFIKMVVGMITLLLDILIFRIPLAIIANIFSLDYSLFFAEIFSTRYDSCSQDSITLLGTIIMILVWTVVGVLIGLIIEMIKRRKK